MTNENFRRRHIFGWLIISEINCHSQFSPPSHHVFFPGKFYHHIDDRGVEQLKAIKFAKTCVIWQNYGRVPVCNERAVLYTTPPDSPNHHRPVAEMSQSFCCSLSIVSFPSFVWCSWLRCCSMVFSLPHSRNCHLLNWSDFFFLQVSFHHVRQCTGRHIWTTWHLLCDGFGISNCACHQTEWTSGMYYLQRWTWRVCCAGLEGACAWRTTLV